MRQALANVGQDYGVVQVPYVREARNEVRALTGQEKTPVLVDGDVVVADSRRIVAHLACLFAGEAEAGALTCRGGPIALPAKSANCSGSCGARCS